MVQANPTQRLFDGVDPNTVVFGETLGEGKQLARLAETNWTLLYRRLWSCECWLAEVRPLKKVCDQVNEEA